MFLEKHPCKICPESALSVEIVNSLLNYTTLIFFSVSTQDWTVSLSFPLISCRSDIQRLFTSVGNVVLESFGGSHLEDQSFGGTGPTSFVKQNSGKTKLFCSLSYLILCHIFSLLVTGRPISQ